MVGSAVQNDTRLIVVIKRPGKIPMIAPHRSQEDGLEWGLSQFRKRRTPCFAADQPVGYAKVFRRRTAVR